MTQAPPTDPAAQLQWLIDRAAITDLILSFARCVDDSDTDTYANNFLEDGELILPFAHLKSREEIRALPGLPKGWATQHLVGNILIDIDGDTARTRAYIVATHVFDVTTPSNNAQAGGWYVHDVVRTTDGWRFRRVDLTLVWETEKPLLGENPLERTEDGAAIS